MRRVFDTLFEGKLVVPKNDGTQKSDRGILKEFDTYTVRHHRRKRREFADFPK